MLQEYHIFRVIVISEIAYEEIISLPIFRSSLAFESCSNSL